MAESEEIAGLKIGFSADMGELESSLVAARESLNSWLSEQRSKQIKIKVTPDKDTASFDSIVADVEKQLQGLANGEPVPIKISLQPSVQSIRDTKQRIGQALRGVEVDIVGKFVGWADGKAPTVDIGKGKKGAAAAGEPAAPAQATQGAGDCCDDIVQAIKALGTKLEALVHAAPGQSNVVDAKTPKNSPATAATQATQAAPAPASHEAAASAAPPATAARTSTCFTCGWSGPAGQSGMHTRWRQHRDALAAKASGATPAQNAAPPAEPRPQQAPRPQPTGRPSFDQWWANQQAAQANFGPERPRMTEAEGRALYDRYSGVANAATAQPTKQQPARPRAEASAPVASWAEAHRGTTIAHRTANAVMADAVMRGNATDYDDARRQLEAAGATVRGGTRSGTKPSDAGGTVDFDNGSIEVPPTASYQAQSKEEDRAQYEADQKRAARKAADDARKERDSKPYTCPGCGGRLNSSRPGRIKSHEASQEHINKTKGTQRNAARAEAPVAAGVTTPAAAATASPDAIARYRAQIGANDQPDLGAVEYWPPGMSAPSQKWVQLPSVSELLMEAEGMEPGQTGQLPYIDMSGLQSVGKGARKGARGTRLARNILNPYDDEGNLRLPAVEQYQNILKARRQLIEQRTPMPEGRRIFERIRETKGSLKRNYVGDNILDAIEFGPDMPEAEQKHIADRLRAAQEATRRQATEEPTGGTQAEREEWQRRAQNREMIARAGQEAGDPLAGIFATAGVDQPKFEWADFGWGDFDKQMRAAVTSTAGQRDDLAHDLLKKLGPQGLDVDKIPSLSEGDPDFGNVQAALGNMLSAGQFSDVLRHVQPEMDVLHAAAPGLTNALQKGFLLPETVPPSVPAAQVQKRFLTLNALKESARAGLNMGETIGEYKPAATPETRAQYEARITELAEILGQDPATLMKPEAEPKPEGPVMATAATVGQEGRRKWLLGRKERTPEQQKELESLGDVERARRRQRFTERLSTRRAPVAAGPERPKPQVGTSYPRPPKAVAAIADERRAGIEWMARLFSYQNRTPAEESQLEYLKQQHPRAVRTATDLYPQESDEDYEERRNAQEIAEHRRSMARMQTLMRNEEGLSPDRREELAGLEKRYPRVSAVARGKQVPGPRRVQGLGADIDVTESLRSELTQQVAELQKDVDATRLAGRHETGEAMANEHAKATRDLELLNQYFPTGKYENPVAKAREFASKPLKSRNRPATERRQAAELILARQRQDRQAQPRVSAEEAAAIRERADRAIAAMTAPPPEPAQPTITPEAMAAAGMSPESTFNGQPIGQAPVRPTTRARDARGRYTTAPIAPPTGVRYRGRHVSQQLVRDLGMSSGETPEQAVKKMVDAGQMTDAIRAAVEKNFGQTIDEIVARASAGAATPSPAAAGAAGAGVAPPPAPPPSPAAAAAAAGGRRAAAGAAAPPPPPPPPGGGGPGGPPPAGPPVPPVPPVVPPPAILGVKQRSLNQILQSARMRGVDEGRLIPMQVPQDIGEIPDFPNVFQQMRLFGGGQPGMLPAPTGGAPAQASLMARLVSARAGVQEQIQMTPVRAMSVAAGQYAATIGARGGVRARQEDFNQKAGQAQAGIKLEQDAFARVRALNEERSALHKQARSGTNVSKELDENLKELQLVRRQHRSFRASATKLVGAAEEAAKGVSTFGTQMANLGFGALGIVGGTLAFGATLAAGQAVVGGLMEAMKPGIEQMTGFTERIRGVTTGLRDAAMPTGDVAGAVAGQLAQAGGPDALGERLAPALEARTAQSVQNRRLEMTVDLMRTAFQTRREESARPGVTNYRGVYQPTGGMNILGMQTNIGAEPAFLEQAGLHFQQQGPSDLPWNTFLRPDRDPNVQRSLAEGDLVTTLFQQGPAALGALMGGNQAGPEAAARQLDLLNQESGDLLAMFAGAQKVGVTAINPTLNDANGGPTISDEDRRAQERLVRDMGATDLADAIKSGSLAFVDEMGNAELGLRELNAAFNQSAQEFLRPSARQWAASQQHPMEAANFGRMERLQHQLDTVLPAQRAMQRLVNPATPFGFGMTGASGAAGRAQRAALGQFQSDADPLMDQRRALAASDEAALRSIPGVSGAQVDQLKAYGEEVMRVQGAMAQRQNVTAANQYNEQLRLSKQQLGDVLGLSGQIGAVEQSRVGVLERQNMLISRHIEDLGREAQAMQLGMSQRQINYNLATAGFTTTGTTPAEVAANMRYAEMQAKYAQDQLNIQKEIYDEQGKLIPNQREIQDTQIDRQVEALENAINLMEEGFATDQFVKAGQSYLDTMAGANAGLIEGFGAITSSGLEFQQQQLAFREQMKLNTEATISEINQFTDETFSHLLEEYDNFASHIQLPGFKYDPPEERATGDDREGRPTGPGVPTANAAGWIGQVNAPTTATFGEAGSETVAILRNPRTHTIMPDGGGGSTSLTVQFNGEVNVREDADIDRIAQRVETMFNQRSSLLGLNR